VVLGGRVVLLVDGDDGVDNFGGDGLLVDDGLDSLVDVVVDVLALDSRGGRCSVAGLVGMGGVLELGSLTLESLASLVVVAVVEFLVDGIFHHVVVLLREDLLMLDWLDGGVVMVLMDLAVDCLLDLLMATGLDVLAGDSRADAFGHVGGMASLARDAGNCGSSFVHVDAR
jgi:hypothetical protein